MTLAYSHAFADMPAARDLPALLSADGEAAVARGRRSLEDGGFICAAPLAIRETEERLDNQGRLGLLWLELESIDDESEKLLRRVNDDVQRQRYSAVVAAAPELIDPVTALITASEVQVVIGRSELERAAALALSTASRSTGRVHESSSDESSARLRQLSEEVSRIAATLARLSGEEARPSPLGTEAPPTGDLPAVPAEQVRAVIRARRKRADYLPADLFADPAWDMLLDLLQAELVQHRVPVSSLCIAAAVPATTALRWIRTMTDRRLLVRRPDPHDGRRVFMEMSRSTSHALRRLFVEAGPALI